MYLIWHNFSDRDSKVLNVCLKKTLKINFHFKVMLYRAMQIYMPLKYIYNYYIYIFKHV